MKVWVVEGKNKSGKTLCGLAHAPTEAAAVRKFLADSKTRGYKPTRIMTEAEYKALHKPAKRRAVRKRYESFADIPAGERRLSARRIEARYRASGFSRSVARAAGRSAIGIRRMPPALARYWKKKRSVRR